SVAAAVAGRAVRTLQTSLAVESLLVLHLLTVIRRRRLVIFPWAGRWRLVFALAVRVRVPAHLRARTSGVLHRVGRRRTDGARRALIVRVDRARAATRRARRVARRRLRGRRTRPHDESRQRGGRDRDVSLLHASPPACGVVGVAVSTGAARL